MAAIDFIRRIVFLSQGRGATADKSCDSTGFGGNIGGVVGEAFEVTVYKQDLPNST
jgi:hypothetical protein